MKRKMNFIVGIMICLTLIVSLPFPVLALSDRPQYNEKGEFIPNPFAEGDALRYGGLFGPLPQEDPWENLVIENRNPGLVNPFEAYGRGMRIFARDMGFAVSDSRFKAINDKSNSSS